MATPPQTAPASPTPLAFFWGDDDLSMARAVDRFEVGLAEATGGPMERWRMRGDRNGASGQVAELTARLSTPVMFGGGTLAIVSSPGSLVLRTADRDAFLSAMTLIAPGNGLVILAVADGAARAPAPKRLADAVTAGGGTVRRFQAPKASGLAGWIEAEARDRGLLLGPGAAKALAERIGGFVTEGDAERTQQTRIASMELDKLGLYRGVAPIGPADVEALVAEAVPGSVWAFTDAVGLRRVTVALDWLDRLFDVTPEPVLLAVLHRRIRELIETADRVGSGERLSAVGKAMGIASEYRMERLREQAGLWSVADLCAALDGLVELDAMVKGVPGHERGDAQRRLAFSLWVMDHVRATRIAIA
jgi:DNA polymerase III delta subunit